MTRPVSPPRPELLRLWRGFDDPAHDPALRRVLRAEFPAAAALAEGPGRRGFLRLMAASLALAGLAGCDEAEDGHAQEVPYVRQPGRMTAGRLMRFASATVLDGFANGVTVNTRNGRPLKIEGNDAHPWSRGGTDAFGQASVLGLYDPYRSQSVRYLDRISDWQAFGGAVTGWFGALRAGGGAGLRVLTGPLTSPATLAQVAALRAAYPEMHWHSHAPVTRAALYEGTARAFGRRLETRWRFERARVIVSLDGDFLDPGPQQVGVARDWIAARQAAARGGALPALHAVAATPGLTSARADFHVPAGPDAIAALAEGLIADISTDGGGEGSGGGGDALAAWRARAAAALRGARGASIVLAGATQPPEVQAAVHRLNAMLGNLGSTVFFTASAEAEAESLGALTAAMARGEVGTLVMLDVNPAYDAPADLDFAEHLGRVRLKIHAGLYADETAQRCDWHLPLAHPLESWGDARSLDGTVSLLQPTIAPLYGGRSVAEILSLLATPEAPRGGHDLLRAHWQESVDDAAWHEALLHGFLPGTAFAPEPVGAPAAAPARAPAAGLHVLFRPDPGVWDGSLASNAWLQEMPRPLTKLVWENAISVAPALAAREGIAQGDVVVVEAGGRNLAGPVWIMPGQADDAVTVSLGYGRTALDLLAPGTGYDAYALRRADQPWQIAGATLRRTGRRVELATAQFHNTMEGHDFVRVQRIGSAPSGGDGADTAPHLYGATKADGDGRAWGMVIDLDSCIGCNACAVACQAENNIAVVGREQVMAGREMHWLRIDRYFAGPAANPDTHFQPVPCMHCEDAPCEVGCPVEATLHDHEGLNLMVYNRCVGTRACSSYCPYKVRRFNYYDYSAKASPSEQQQHNPEVTVRARGVMEKCTYCVQRIAEARIEADRTDRPIPVNAVQTACQNACPTRAIHFGDLARDDSDVTAARRDPRNYALLGELNVRPRTTYLAKWAPPDAPDLPPAG
jgi:MoCo/4Fe-4S cofactor protein with predicted Tat translocation signal